MMRLPRFDYARPVSVMEACSILAENGAEATIMAGGTELLAACK